MRKLILFLVITALFAGCSSDDKPAGLIPKDKMIKILFDMHIAEANMAMHSGESSVDTLIVASYQHIYKTHTIDSVSFRKSFEYYTANPEQLEEIYRVLLEEVSKKQAELGETAQTNPPPVVPPNESAKAFGERIRSKIVFKPKK